MTTARVRAVPLAATLCLLAAVFAAWFAQDRHWLASHLVFTLPPLLLAIGVLARRRSAPFWSSVLALGWFSHGVMHAWSSPEAALYAWGEILLSLAVITQASLPGARARLQSRRRGPQG